MLRYSSSYDVVRFPALLWTTIESAVVSVLYDVAVAASFVKDITHEADDVYYSRCTFCWEYSHYV